MSKEVKTGAAPVSKYAAKKAAVAKVNAEENAKANVVIDVEKAKANQPAVSTKPNKKKGIPDTADNYPQHFVEIALLIKNNAEIRRFTALGILNYLLQKKEIKGEQRYVSFKWNKFAVKCGGLIREYSYNEPFFLNALVASFSSFSAAAQRIIDNFCHKEMSVSISKGVSQEEVDNIVALNEEYQENKENITED